jgi:glycosyltransferase involved in cell wall biosynthesis
MRALGALARQRVPAAEYEVIVVVDGSDDGSYEAAATFAAPFTLHVLWQSNRGRAAACNAGAAIACGELLVLLDDDMEAMPDLLLAHARAHPGGTRRAVMGAAPIAVEDGAPCPVTFIGHKFNQHLEHLAALEGCFTLRDFYSGNLSIRHDVFDEVGGFDEAFTVYGNEDLDLSIRLRAAGVELAYCAQAVARQSYDKDFVALARDNMSKGRTAVLLARKHPSAAAELKLGTYARESLRRRALVGALLGATRILPAMPQGVARTVSRLDRGHLPGVQRLYGPLLDYFYWCGVRAARVGAAAP